MDCLYGFNNWKTNSIRHGRVDSTDEITFPQYSHYLCFTVSVKTNKFALKNNNKYSPEQEKIFQKIKSLHQSGLGYRKIAHKLNSENIKTHRGKRWGCNNVYSVLKRHKERKERIDFINKEYKPVWGKMKTKYLKI